VALIAGSGRPDEVPPSPAAAVETPGLAAEAGGRPVGRWAGLPEAVGAGLLLGLARIALERAPDVAGLWPVAAVRVSGVVVLGLVAMATRSAIRLPDRRPWLILAIGAFEATASAFFLIATTRGLLAVVGVVASLGPAVTVLLARVVLHERLSRLQVAGVVLALAGVVLIALP
jgi:drug/metabolite transporter (DMT)-like permease